MTITLPDLASFIWFVAAWIVYSIVIERSAKGRTGLNALMNRYRDEWMERLLERDIRMVDAQVTAALQIGAAFFASTSLIAIGGGLTILRSSEEIMTVMSLLPFGATPSRSLWDLKMMGLIVIFVYAFFKFAWSYRLSWSALRRRPIRKRPRLHRLSRTGRRDCVPTRAATLIAASAHSSLRLPIWAGGPEISRNAGLQWLTAPKAHPDGEKLLAALANLLLRGPVECGQCPAKA